MASFAKKPAGTNGNKKKNIIAAIMAAVLAVVLVQQFTKTSSSEAAVQNPGAAGTSEPAMPTETPASVKAALDAEFGSAAKTAVEPPTALDNPPKDPFQLSQNWRDRLIKTVVAVNTVEAQEVIPHPQEKPTGNAEAKPGLPKWDPAALRLTGIFRGNVKPYAVINGSIITEGMIVGGARVIEIGEDHVTLQQIGAPDAARVDLMIKRPGLK